MEKTFNKENGQTTWLLNRWYHKTFYVVGIISLLYLAFCFIVGLTVGIASWI